MYDIINIIMKDVWKIIKDIENFPYKGYVGKRPKHETTDSSFYLARHLAKCTMIANPLNSQVYPRITEMTGMQNIPISHVCSSDEIK